MENSAFDRLINYNEYIMQDKPRWGVSNEGKYWKVRNSQQVGIGRPCT